MSFLQPASFPMHKHKQKEHDMNRFIALVGIGAATCAAALLTLTAVASAAPAPHRYPAHVAIASAGQTAIRLSGSPGVPAVNPRTDTVYVPIQCTNRTCSTLAHVVDVINAARCNARTTSGCRVVATARAGSSPLAAVVDAATDTVYVVNGGGTISVLNGARCNAAVTSGCGRPVATIRLGSFTVAAALDSATGTLYVASPAGFVYAVDAAGCSAVTTRGCSRPARRIGDSQDPSAVGVDIATDTVYAVNNGPTGSGNTVSLINGAACNATAGRGCSRAPRRVTVGSGALWDVVDQAADTVYVANYNAGTVSVINGATCNARVSHGCRHTKSVTVGAEPAFVALDSALHTVLTVNQGDDTLSVINTRTCDGSHAYGCHGTAPAQQAGSEQNRGYAPFPGALALLPGSGTAYVVTVGGASRMSVLGIGGCTATDTRDCRRPASSAPDHDFLASVDPATDTIYAGDLTKPQIDVINAATCRAGHLTRCAPVAAIPMPDPAANVGAVDDASHTLYASDESASGSVAVINTATCNARQTSGCQAHPPLISLGGAYPGPPELDDATATLYVPYGSAANQVAVISTADCTAADTVGCHQPVATVTVGDGTSELGISQAANTIYAPSSGSGQFNGDTVAVINGATCNGASTAGCANLAGTIKVGRGPFGVAVDDAAHTLYVANNADGDSPGTVSVVNTATCNGTDVAGCHGHFPVIAAGVSPLQAALDKNAGALYVTDFASAQLTIINTTHCNAADSHGCATASRETTVGSEPFGVIVDQRNRTVYVTDLFQAGGMSVLAAGR
jgi:DNA-binding beta-propeller fold protein YncE